MLRHRSLSTVGPVLTATLGAVLLTACASPSLTPAPQADRLEGRPAVATTSAAGVEIIAESPDWPGEVEIEEVVTPMQVTIRNGSDHPVRLSYADFSLVEPGNGTRFAALPPWDVRGDVDLRVASGYRVAPGTALRLRGFRVAPYYDPIYPWLGAYTGYPYYSASPYYRNYYRYWDDIEIELPTPGMLERAIPEGVIDPGGMVRGYLYFERVEGIDEGTRLDFRADLVDAASGEVFASLDIPFVLDGMMAMTADADPAADARSR